MTACGGVFVGSEEARVSERRRDAPSSSSGRITVQLEPDTVPTPNRGLAEELAEDESGMQEEVCVCLWK